MTKRLRLSLILICLLLTGLASDPLYAQFPQTIELGPHAGITTYQGDINPWKLFNQFDPGLRAIFKFVPKWSFILWALRQQYEQLDRIAAQITAYSGELSMRHDEE